MFFSKLSVMVLALLFSRGAFAQQWTPVVGADQLREIVSGTVLEGTLKEGVQAIAQYNSDGTAVLNAWGGSFSRTWWVKGEDQICIDTGDEQRCLKFEKSLEETETYRAINVDTGESAQFTVTKGDSPTQVSTPTGSAGGVAKPSADEIAKALANPNTPLASMTLKIQHRVFTGDLSDADDQSGTMMLFQPTFPFPLDNGATVFFRPAIPVMLNQPVYDGAEDDFDSESGLGDIAFDLAYGRTTDAGILWLVGLVSTLPTATEDTLGQDRWTLGPEFMIGKVAKKYVLGALTSYQTDIGGSGDADVSLTSSQIFATYLPGGGWNVGTAPIVGYNHESSEWTVPINLTVGKTVIMGGRPWKLGIEVNYYTEQADAFGPEWMIGLNIAPVVENVFAGMLQ
jgi:hypothetical protein